MNVIVVIEADFERGPLGTRSRLREALRGEPVLRRTVERVRLAKRVTSVHVVVPVEQEPAAKDVLAGLDCEIETQNAGPAPWAGYVASARKWSLDAWRGGLGGATVFDESAHVWVLEGLARREKADAVVTVPAAAAVIDPMLIDRLVNHLEEVSGQVRMAFTQTPPGLSVAVYMPALLADLIQAKHPPGKMMAYRPGDPQKDMVMQSCFLSIESEVMYATGRCLADTQSGFERVAAILDDAGLAPSRATGSTPTNGEMPDAITVSRWLAARRHVPAHPLPAEVEIELTTDDPLAESTLRPRGVHAGQRGPMSFALFEKLIDELASRDDTRVILGGFGDPLRHPELGRCLATCRQAEIFGLAVKTTAVDLDEKTIDALLEHRVDVLHVLIDAASAETYRRVHRADHFDRVIANLDRLFERQRSRNQPQPLVVCELLKTRETTDDLEAFYDHWINRTGSAMIAGPSHYAGQWPDHAVIPMSPPTRSPCRRIFQRTMVLADGRVPACDQDFTGRHALGNVADTSLAAIWQGPAFQAVRQSHLTRTYGALPLCAACDEWHRP